MQRAIRLACLAMLCSVISSTAAAETPPELARWLAPQEWQRDVDGPIVSLGKEGDFDDMHVFAPTVIQEAGRFLMWYPGSRGPRNGRFFRLGMASGADGKQFEKSPHNPVLEMSDGEHSILTPCILRDGNGSVVREQGKLRMWFASCAFAKSPLHTLHETTSADGVHWSTPSAALLENVYCPTVLKTDEGYRMWFADVSKRPWVIRHASSGDGTKWNVTERPVLGLSQNWEVEILVYPTVLKVDGVYLMWYGSYDNAVRRQTTAIGFAASVDGLKWYKLPQNPVLRPDPARPWESNYVGSGCVSRLADGSFRYWYASRKAPPFLNLYFAINTARWSGPAAATAKPQAANHPRLRLPLKKDDVGTLEPAPTRRPITRSRCSKSSTTTTRSCDPGSPATRPPAKTQPSPTCGCVASTPTASPPDRRRNSRRYSA